MKKNSLKFENDYLTESSIATWLLSFKNWDTELIEWVKKQNLFVSMEICIYGKEEENV